MNIKTMYPLTLKNIGIDLLILGLCATSILIARNNTESPAPMWHFYLMVFAGGVFLFRWTYLSYAYFYGKNQPSHQSLFFKAHRAFMTLGAVLACGMYFTFIFIFLL